MPTGRERGRGRLRGKSLRLTVALLLALLGSVLLATDLFLNRIPAQPVQIDAPAGAAAPAESSE